MALHSLSHRQPECTQKMHCKKQRNRHFHRREMSNAAIIPMLMMIASTTHGFAPRSFSSHHGTPKSFSSLQRTQPAADRVSTRWGRKFQYWSVANDDELPLQQTVADKPSSDTSNEDKLDNLIPSTMISTRNSFVRTNSVARGSRSGLSSSVLRPSPSEADQPSLPPLFQVTPSSNIRSSQEVSTSEVSTGNNNNTGSWKERLLDVSNFASLLCVLDCTLLPLVSIAIPALSWGVGFFIGSGGAYTAVPPALSAFLAYLPVLSHGIALYFVIPVGLLTTVINFFFGHREVKFSTSALFGVALIYAANSSTGVGIPSIDAWLQATGIVGGVHDHAGHVHDACGAVVGAATKMMAHTCPEGWAHRMTNTVGCAFLLGSNYASRKYMEEKNSGCAASALAEAWGGDSGGRQIVCPPGCGCERTSFGTKGSSSSRVGGETFFQWERTSPGGGRSSRGGKPGGVAGGRLRR
mmetsp:Transcript_8567/g.14116  ORF Transcript_8567/g.14116 Transcript_8567/m.14116 type:complete len:466 (+) Transcript_8567:96-1493(+)